MRASVSSTREPMKPESRPSSEQGLDSAVNLAGLITSSPRHPWLSTPLLADFFVPEVSPLSISSVCLITLDFPQPNRERALRAVTKDVVGARALPTRSLFGDGILRRFLRRVSAAKPTSAPLRS